jgi:ribosomal protein S18 acetylase RimI-like enzyme
MVKLSGFELLGDASVYRVSCLAMGAPVVIRPCEDGDWTAACRLLGDVYVGDGYVTPERAEQFYRRDVLEPAGTVLAAVEEETVLGVVVLLNQGSPLRQVAIDGEAEFRLLAVDRRGRGRGIGERLVGECLERASRTPLLARAMVLWTRPAMTAAQRLYGRMGFERTPERDAMLPPLPAGSTLVRWVYRRGL